MPFTLSLSKTSSPRRCIVKSLSSTKNFKFVFKAPTSYLSPVVTIATGDDILGYNYASIDLDITRWYYVTDIVLLRQNEYEIHLREDVLATYSKDILSQTFYIDRSSNPSVYDTDILDRLRPKKYIQKTSESFATADLTQADDISTTGVDVMKNGFVASGQGSVTTFAVIVARSGSNMVLPHGTIGKRPDRNNTISRENFFPDVCSVYMYCCEYAEAGALAKWLGDHKDQAESIVGIYLYPYSIPHGEAVHTIRIAGQDQDLDSAGTLNFYGIDVHPIVLADFLWISSLFSNRHGAEIGDCNFQLYLPYVGNITLDPSLMDEHDEIQIVYIPIYQNNEALVLVSDVTKNIVLHSETTSIGQEVPFSQSNSQDIRDIWTKLGIKSAVTLVADGLAVGSGNMFAIMGAGANTARNTGDIISTALTTRYQSSVKVPSANTGYYMWNECRLIITKPDYTMYYGSDQDYETRLGLPAERFSALLPDNRSSAPDYAYYKTDTDRVAGTMSDTEKTEIISLLNSGVLVPKTS